MHEEKAKNKSHAETVSGDIIDDKERKSDTEEAKSDKHGKDELHEREEAKYKETTSDDVTKDKKKISVIEGAKADKYIKDKLQKVETKTK